ncbi:MAG: hypothetical protein JWR69_4314 [Pedosphaera sp.]|nr:hypothetical protein [Pedosphaera sp.]
MWRAWLREPLADRFSRCGPSAVLSIVNIYRQIFVTNRHKPRGRQRPGVLKNAIAGASETLAVSNPQQIAGFSGTNSSALSGTNIFRAKNWMIVDSNGDNSVHDEADSARRGSKMPIQAQEHHPKHLIMKHSQSHFCTLQVGLPAGFKPDFSGDLGLAPALLVNVIRLPWHQCRQSKAK